VGSAVAAPSVLVKDSHGNPVSGFNVTFTLTATGGSGAAAGSISPTSVATVASNSSGVASLSTWTLGLTAGAANTVTATAAGITTVTFNGTSTAATAQNIVAGSATSQTNTVGLTVTAPSVTVRDANNNPVQGVVVTFTTTAGNGTTSPVSGSTVTTNSSGVAALTTWTLGATAGTNTVQATVSGLSGSPVVFNATGTAAAATTIAFSAGNGGQTATVGTAVAISPSVLVTDAGGNPVAGVNVTFAVASGSGSISSPSGSVVATNASGIAALSSWVLGPTAGTSNNSVTATATGLTGSPLTFTASATAGAASQISRSAGTNNQSATVGTAVTNPPSVLVRDAFSNPVSGTVVTFTVTAGSGTTSPASGGTVTTNSSGVAALTSWTLGNAAGTNTVQATAAGLSGSPVNFTATGTSTATHYILTPSSPTTPTAGTTVTVTAQLADASNNPVPTSGKTVVWSKTCNGGSCVAGATGGSFATPSSITDANGQAVIAFTVSTTAAVIHTVTATDNTSLTGTSASITTAAGSFTRLQLLVPGETAAPGTVTGKTGTPSATTAGNSFSVTVNAVDANWNVVTTAASDNIAITSSDANATLPSNNTLSSGTRTFSVSLNTAGTATITATDASNGGITANTSPSITINAGSYSQLQVLVAGETANPGSATGKTGTPSAQAAGTGFTATVNAVDSRFNLLTGVTETVTITTSDPNDTHPAPAALVSGTKNFTVTFVTAGSWTVSASGAPSGKTGTSASITTTAGAFTTLQLLVPGETAAPGTSTGKTGAPSATTAGNSFSVTVNAVDANWNVVTTAPSDNIAITSSDANATLPSNNTLSSGTRTFSVSLNTAGTATITATDATDGTKTANTSPSITINAGSFSQLQVLVPGETANAGSTTGKTGTPSTQAAGTGFPVTVNAVDSRFNLLTGVTETVTLTTSDPNDVEPAPAPLVGGTKNFTVTFVTAGSWTVSASAAPSAKTGTSASVTTTAGAFAKLQLLAPGENAAPGTATGKTGTPTAEAAGTGFSVIVNAVDANWNVVTTAPANNVAITSNDANAVLPSNNTLSSGTQTFSVTFHTAGSFTITATDADDGTKTANTSPSITVNPGTFTMLQLLVPGESPAPGTATGKTGSPTSETAGTQFSITVNGVDAFWNTVTTTTDHVAITSSDGSASLPSNAQLSSGTVNFNFTFHDAPSFTITATDADNSGGITANTSPAIVVAAAVPSAPTNLSATPNGTGNVDLTWTAPPANGSPISDYFVEWSTDGFGTVAGSSNVGSNTTSFSVSPLTSGTPYQFRVSAINGIGTGGPSSTASATPPLVLSLSRGVLAAERGSTRSSVFEGS
jgi:anti-sigma factor ChrR (cupin superfamily)